jgi:hypothetical protein
MQAQHPRPDLGRCAHGRTSVLLVLVLALALLLTGCGGKDAAKKSEDKKPGTSKGPTTDEEPAPDPGYGAPKVGECHRMTAQQSLASVAASRSVGCKAAHTSVVAYVGFQRVPITPKTSVQERKKLGQKLCEPAYRRLAGGTLADRAMSILTWTLFTPGQDQLERGARWVRCDMIARSGTKLIRLPAGTPMLAKGVPDQLRVCQTATGSDVSCAQPHAFRVQAVFLASPASKPRAPYPDTAAYTARARARCQQLTGKPGGYWQPPSRVGWNAGDHFIRCLTPES